MADAHEIQAEYGLAVTTEEALLKPANAVILAVAHQYFMDKSWPYMAQLLIDQAGIVIDVKGKLDRDTIPDNIRFWRL